MAYPEPPEAQSIRSVLKIARLLAIVFGIILLIGGIAYIAVVAYYISVCNSFVGVDPYCGAAWVGALGGIVWLVISGAFLFLVYMQMKSIETKVNNRQYEEAKSQTLIWMILGFIFGIILGVVLIFAFIKFDPLITAQRNMAMGGGQMPPPGAPPMYAAPPPMAAAAPAPGAAPAPPPPAPGAQAAPFCGTCGKPTTYIPQYGRYYCYDCKQYV